MSSPRPAGGDPATRRRILERALEVLRTDGAGAFRVSAIARSAGVSRQAVYLHFQDRAGLLGATVQHAHAQLGIQARMDALAHETDPLAALDELCDLWTHLVAEDHAALLAVQRLQELDPALAAAWRSRPGRAQAIAGVVDRLAAAHLLHPELSRAHAVDLLAAVLSLSPAVELVVVRGWSPAAAGRALARAGRAVLLAPSHASATAGSALP